MHKTILVTGGAGYIGSHTVVELIDEGYDVVIVDNLSNSTRGAVERLNEVTGRDIPFYQVDVADKQALAKVCNQHTIDAVIHFAGFKAVGESVARPLVYYRNNLDSLLSLCEVMLEHKVYNVVFSSSATVYGRPENPRLTENSPLKPVNPYGQTKFMCERILQDLAHAEPQMKVTILRYFNPIGAHPSGKLGEQPVGTPNNLFPYVVDVAAGIRPELTVFGDDYDTPDGTGIRDYIHVMDLATGHSKALQHAKPGTQIYNLGTGRGTSVLEVITTFEKTTGQKVNYKIGPRRAGDPAEYFADPSLANKELGWQAEKTVADACQDSWRWKQANPNGYPQ